MQLLLLGPQECDRRAYSMRPHHLGAVHLRVVRLGEFLRAQRAVPGLAVPQRPIGALCPALLLDAWGLRACDVGNVASFNPFPRGLVFA